MAFPNIRIPNIPKIPSIHDIGKGSTEEDIGNGRVVDRDIGIDRMVAKLSQDPILSPAQYIVQITPPDKVVGNPHYNDLKIDANLFLSVSSINLPTRSYATVEHAHWGPNIMVPYQEVYDQVTMMFYMSESMNERRFFDIWLDAVGSREYDSSSDGEYNNKMEYYNNFIGQCVLFPLSRDGRRLRKYKIHNLYPTQMSPSLWGHAMANAYSEITIQFGIDRYEQDKSFVPDSEPVTSLFSKLYNIGASLADIPGDLVPSINPFGGR